MDRIQTVLAVDAALTVLAGLVVARFPAVVEPRLPDTPALRHLDDPSRVRWAGLAVAVFGATKGLLYAFASQKVLREPHTETH